MKIEEPDYQEEPPTQLILDPETDAQSAMENTGSTNGDGRPAAIVDTQDHAENQHTNQVILPKVIHIIIAN